MEFGPSKPQQMLQQSMVALLEQYATLGRVRTIMESEDGIDRTLIAALAEQGTLGLLIPERFGGTGVGLFEVSLVAQELGRFAAPFDLLASAVTTPLLISAAGSEDQKESWLTRMAGGEEILAVARGPRLENGRIQGQAHFVPGVAQSTSLLVEIGGRCFVVPTTADGVAVEHLRTIDETRRWSEVSFDRVEVSEVGRLVNRIRAKDLLRVSQAAQVAVAADSLGACYRAIEIAVEYAKNREQFGRVVASFQAVKHLCAEMIADVDPLQSLVWYAAYAWDQQQNDSAHVAPLCKAHAAEVGYDCVTKATQVFGGMGFTWECDMHIYFKRVQVDRQLLGRPEEHREQAAVAQLG